MTYRSGWIQTSAISSSPLNWNAIATLPILPLIFEAGCGSGFEARSLDRVTKGDIFGIDMNLTVIRNGATIAANPFNKSCRRFRFRHSGTVKSL